VSEKSGVSLRSSAVTLTPTPGPDHDPGYLASLRYGVGPLGATRRLVLGLVVAPVPLWLLMPFLDSARRFPAGALLLVAGAVIVAMMLGRLVLETVTPLSPTLGPAVARSRSLVVFRRRR
jgi:hypothetical protein